MEHILIIFSFLLMLTVIIKILNEKFFKLSTDIALVLFSFLFFLLIRIIVEIFKIDLSANIIYVLLKEINLHEFLTEGVLCFLLFANASRLKLKKMVSNIKSITIFGFFTSIIYCLLFGFILHFITSFTPLKIDLIYCILLGAILTPSEPFIILHKLTHKGLDKSLQVNIEGEALINDGVGIALFVFFKNIIINSSLNNISFEVIFELLIFKILGAFVIGLVISYLTFKLIMITKQPINHIFISLITVMVCFVICEHFGFSGDIACVISGIYFSYKREKESSSFEVLDEHDYYNHFWKIVDSMLNSVLFVLIGSYVLFLDLNFIVIIISLLAILINLVSRFISVYITSLPFTKRSLSNYSKQNFSLLLSWFGLRGAVSLALALSTVHFLDSETYLFFIWATYITVYFTIVIQGISSTKVLQLINKNKKQKDIKKFKGEK